MLDPWLNKAGRTEQKTLKSGKKSEIKNNGVRYMNDKKKEASKSIKNPFPVSTCRCIPCP
jgi:hypothetical protein